MNILLEKLIMTVLVSFQVEIWLNDNYKNKVRLTRAGLGINWNSENHLKIWEIIINIKRLFTYLSVCVFNGGDVRIIKRSIDETQNKTSFAYSPSSKSHHTIVIALFWHYLTILGGKTGDKFNNNFFSWW